MQQLEQELPYLNCSTEDACGGGGGCSAASSSVAGAVQPVAELLSSLVQHWKGVRVSRKRVWGECMVCCSHPPDHPLGVKLCNRLS